MPRLTSVERERAVGMLQSGLRAADVDRCVMCHTRQYCAGCIVPRRLGLQGTVHTVTSVAQERNIRLMHLRDWRRPATKMLLKHQGVIMPEYLLKSCVIVSGDLARVLNTRIEALSWQSSGVLQGSIGVPGNANRFSLLMSPGFVSLRVSGSEYGTCRFEWHPQRQTLRGRGFRTWCPALRPRSWADFFSRTTPTLTLPASHRNSWEPMQSTNCPGQCTYPTCHPSSTRGTWLIVA